MASGNRLTSTGKSVGVVFFYDWRIKSCLHCTNMAYTVGSIYLSIAELLFYKRLFRIMLTMQGICSRRTSARRNSCEGNATSPIGRRAAAILLPFEILITTAFISLLLLIGYGFPPLLIACSISWVLPTHLKRWYNLRESNAANEIGG